MGLAKRFKWIKLFCSSERQTNRVGWLASKTPIFLPSMRGAVVPVCAFRTVSPPSPHAPHQA